MATSSSTMRSRPTSIPHTGKRFGVRRPRPTDAPTSRRCRNSPRLSMGGAGWPAIPPLLIPIRELVGQAQAQQYDQQMSVVIDEYGQSLDPSRRGHIRRFYYVEGARKVVGVGSVGARAWVILLLG